MTDISLVIFTCEGREQLLKKTIDSFRAACNYSFHTVILAIDGVLDTSIIEYINPDFIVNGYKRKGYVISIKNTLPNIKTPFFFLLEDDWTFHGPVNIQQYANKLQQQPNWAEIAYSKYGPLTDEFKVTPLTDTLYANINGYTTNPSLQNTQHVKNAFDMLDITREKYNYKDWGFEEILTFYFKEHSVKCALIDPVDHTDISHEGYLESTPRSWHMVSSIENRRTEHLLTIPVPSPARRFWMIIKMLWACVSLSVRQLWSNEIYEICFRIIALNISTKKNERASSGHHNSNG